MAMAIYGSVMADPAGFPVVAPTGQTLYIARITGYNGGLRVVAPGYYDWNGYTKPTGDLEIPATVVLDGNTYAVTEIDYHAFMSCQDLSSVIIPSSVIIIGDAAFSGCTGLTSITIPDNATSIGSNAFAGIPKVYYYGNASGSPWGAYQHYSYPFYEDDGLFYQDSSKTVLVGCISSITSLDVPNTVTTIDNCAFYMCTNITTVFLPNSLRNIGDWAFYGCSNLVSVNIPDSVIALGEHCFQSCNNLTSVTIGDEVISISQCAFALCSRLTSIRLGNNVETIGYRAFAECGIIGELVIPPNIISVENAGFYHCYGINEISSLGRVAPTLGASAFDGVDTSITVNIPCGTTNLYAGRWSYFHNFNEIPFWFNVASADIAQGTVAMLQEPTCDDPVAIVEATPRNGYRFDHWSDGSTQNPYTYTTMGSLTLTAYFASTTEGIADIEEYGARTYTIDGHIVVEGAEGETVHVFDMMGRMVASTAGNDACVPVPIGVYLVKVGTLPARKVVVIR